MDLLERENEFRKLNKQLEKKTEKLMKEIEIVMQKPDIFTDFSQNVSLRLTHNDNVKKHFCATTKQEPERPISFKKIRNVANHQREKEVKNMNKTDVEKVNNQDVVKEVINKKNEIETPDKVACVCCTQRKDKLDPDLEFLYAFVSVSVKEKILPEFFLKGDVTIENICKCLSSKVRLLQEEVDKLQANIKKKGEQCELHLTTIAEMETERLTLVNRSNNCASSAAEMRNKCTRLQNKLDEKDRLYKEQRAETDKLNSELKRLKSKLHNSEAKFASSQQTVENLTMQLQVAKKLEKEYRDNCRLNISTHQSTISSLESTIKRQSSRIDRQTSLIDNLRRQIAILMTESSVNAFEQEYSGFLMQEVE